MIEFKIRRKYHITFFKFKPIEARGAEGRNENFIRNKKTITEETLWYKRSIMTK